MPSGAHHVKERHGVTARWLSKSSGRLSLSHGYQLQLKTDGIIWDEIHSRNGVITTYNLSLVNDDYTQTLQISDENKGYSKFQTRFFFCPYLSLSGHRLDHRNVGPVLAYLREFPELRAPSECSQHRMRAAKCSKIGRNPINKLVDFKGR